jgi:EAL domain-containing protein (putative c-di-GMP-specific phosphodiesterase class I)
VKAIIAMARGLGIGVVAEGIETPVQLEALRALGCDQGQGHLFAPALPARALARFTGYSTRAMMANRNSAASPEATITSPHPGMRFPA